MKVTKHKMINHKSKTYTIDDKLYKEFDEHKNETFNHKLKHAKTVRFILTDTMVTEFDEHDRVTYNKNANGYWSLRFYNPEVFDKDPYEIIHKYWDLYN